MKINFRVVGIFCKLNNFDIGTFTQPPTVRQAMERIRADSSSNFTYLADDEADTDFPAEKSSLAKASFYLDSELTSPTGNKYPPDVYTLSDYIDRERKIAYIFQYYVLRPLGGDNEFKTITNDNRFVPFGMSKTLEDGDSVIWRQVAIKLPNYKIESNEQFKRLASLGVIGSS